MLSESGSLRAALLFHIALLSCGALALTCQDDADCQSSCTATEAGRCVAECSELLQRCQCTQGEALRKDGTCSLTAGAKPVEECTSDYRVTIVVIVPESPELTIQDVETDRPSEAFVTLVRSCTATAINRDVADIVPLQVALTPDGSNGTASFLQFVAARADFDFCLPPPILDVGQLGSAAGNDFGQQADSFDMVGDGSVVVVSWEALQAASRSTTRGPGGSGDKGELESEHDNNDDEDTRSWAFKALLAAIAATVVIAIGFLLVWCWMRHRRHRLTRVVSNTEVQGPIPPLPSATTAEGNHPVVRVARSFNLQEINEAIAADGAMDRCIAVKEGELLEVLVNTGEWLYGRSRERGVLGFFPENRVMWLGRPMPGDPDPILLGRPDAEVNSDLREAADGHGDTDRAEAPVSEGVGGNAAPPVSPIPGTVAGTSAAAYAD